MEREVRETMPAQYHLVARVQGSGFRVQGSGFRVEDPLVSVSEKVCEFRCASLGRAELIYLEQIVKR